jgi:hypothetical protein
MKPALYNGFNQIDVDKFEVTGKEFVKLLSAFKGTKLVHSFDFTAMNFDSNGTLTLTHERTGEMRQITNADKNLVAMVVALFSTKKETEKP